MSIIYQGGWGGMSSILRCFLENFQIFLKFLWHCHPLAPKICHFQAKKATRLQKKMQHCCQGCPNLFVFIFALKKTETSPFCYCSLPHLLQNFESMSISAPHSLQYLVSCMPCLTACAPVLTVV